jgi:hypothetical protein
MGAAIIAATLIAGALVVPAAAAAPQRSVLSAAASDCSGATFPVTCLTDPAGLKALDPGFSVVTMPEAWTTAFAAIAQQNATGIVIPSVERQLKASNFTLTGSPTFGVNATGNITLFQSARNSSIIGLELPVVTNGTVSGVLDKIPVDFAAPSMIALLFHVPPDWKSSALPTNVSFLSGKSWLFDIYQARADPTQPKYRTFIFQVGNLGDPQEEIPLVIEQQGEPNSSGVLVNGGASLPIILMQFIFGAIKTVFQATAASTVAKLAKDYGWAIWNRFDFWLYVITLYAMQLLNTGFSSGFNQFR